jgi:F-type H+-transporting ATPase subunit gamma
MLTVTFPFYLPSLQVRAAGLKEIKVRNDSVKNTKKITDAMKLVAAAKVRRAQDAVVNGRPFSEALVKVHTPPLLYFRCGW